MAEGFRMTQCWAMSACHVTLIDMALEVAQAPVPPRAPVSVFPMIYLHSTEQSLWWLRLILWSLCCLKGMFDFITLHYKINAIKKLHCCTLHYSITF